MAISSATRNSESLFTSSDTFPAVMLSVSGVFSLAEKVNVKETILSMLKSLILSASSAPRAFYHYKGLALHLESGRQRSHYFFQQHNSYCYHVGYL